MIMGHVFGCMSSFYGVFIVEIFTKKKLCCMVLSLVGCHCIGYGSYA